MRTIRILAFAAAAAALAAPLATAQYGFSTLYTLTGNSLFGLTTANGVLYGAASNLPDSCGIVFELQPPPPSGGAWTETLLYTFAGIFDSAGDACGPNAPPVVGAGGVLYGAAYYGGAYGSGAVYELQPPASPGGPWTGSVVYSFVEGPVTGLVAGPDGSFYVITAGRALFQVQPPSAPGGSWTGTTLYTLPSGYPPTSLTTGANGVLYGTSSDERSSGLLGAVFQFTPPAAPGGVWTFAVLHTFSKSDGDAANPFVPLTVTSDGTIFGGTSGSTSEAMGKAVVFELTPPASPGGTWGYTAPHNFGESYYIRVSSPLILNNGNLYSTVTSETGGAVFELQPPATSGDAWTITYLHDFTNQQQPLGALVMNANGAIYATTEDLDQTVPTGTIYRITPE